MDSALECLVYALNGLGFAYAPNSFRDVTDKKALARVNPRDLLGDPNADPPRVPLSGYDDVYPGVCELWRSHRDVIDRVIELYDVSKHRRTIYIGGRMRGDAPPLFFESLGVPEKHRHRYAPAELVTLDPFPKEPDVIRFELEFPENPLRLEELAPRRESCA